MRPKSQSHVLKRERQTVGVRETRHRLRESNYDVEGPGIAECLTANRSNVEGESRPTGLIHGVAGARAAAGTEDVAGAALRVARNVGASVC